MNDDQNFFQKFSLILVVLECYLNYFDRLCQKLFIIRKAIHFHSNTLEKTLKELIEVMNL